MPRLKTFAQKEADRARAAKVKALPREVAQAVAAMTPEEQDHYLASLDRVDDLEAKGETWTPDPRTWGTTKSGKPKAKPGRKPAQAAGARTAEKPEPWRNDPEWTAQQQQIIEELPDDDDEPVVFGAYRDDDGEPPAGPRMTAEQLEQQERAEQEAMLEEALRQRGIATDNVVAGPFAAVRLCPVGDPEDLTNYHVDRIEAELRLIDTGKAYRLELRYLPDGAWESLGDTYEPTGSAGTMARMKVQPVDWDTFGKAVSSLPKPHPAVASIFDNRPRDATGPKTEKERDVVNASVREAMVAARRSNALHRQPDPEPTHDHAFIDDFLSR